MINIFKVIITTIIMSISPLLLPSYTIKIITGAAELKTLVPFIAQQRLSYFRDYPYLYQGKYEEEYTYLEWFSSLPYSAIAVVYHESKPVGFLTGTAFVDFDQHFEGSCSIFEKNALKPALYYYFSEIILPEHHQQNLSSHLFFALENYAKSLGFSAGCFVDESHETHPLKPADYKPLDILWQKIGYKKSSITINFSWPTYQSNGPILQQKHTLSYWLKDF
jgi:hypothetical protein